MNTKTEVVEEMNKEFRHNFIDQLEGSAARYNSGLTPEIDVSGNGVVELLSLAAEKKAEQEDKLNEPMVLKTEDGCHRPSEDFDKMIEDIVKKEGQEGKVKEGLRFNSGKLRYDLLEPFAVENLAKVFTFGANKYAPRNWEKGMKWSSVLASLKRHIAEFEKGEDFDNETGLYHMAHAAWNAMALVSYYKLAPHFDDRDHKYLRMPKIGLDIDDVICDFVGGYCERFNVPNPTNWHCHYDIVKQLGEITADDKFYMGLKPKIDPKDMPFEPHCYITSRSIPKAWTEKWLQDNGFPTRPVYTIPFNTSKVEVAKASGIDIYVDDRYDNFVELNKAGICTYLYDTPHNHKYNVGHKRIKSLKELV